MKKRIVYLLIYFIMVIFLSGCFDARELDELGITLVMGLDIENDKLLLTAEVIDPEYSSDSASTGQRTSVKYIQGTGNNILEAFRDITLKFGRRIYSAHTKAIIFGEDMAKKGLMPYMDELFRDREQRESAYILIAKGTKAYKVMGISSGLETIPADYILDLIEMIENNPKTIDTNMIDFLKYYYHMGQHPVTAVVEKSMKKEINQTGQQTGTQEFELSVIGSAVFMDDTLAGYLNGNDTKSLNFLLDNIDGGLITFPTPSVNTEKQPTQNDELFSSISMIKSSTKNDIVMEDGKIKLKAKIYIRGELREVEGNIDISKYENIEKMARACSKTVEENIKATVEKVKEEFGFDIFGFGHGFHKKHTEEWRRIEENWDEIFADADFEIEVETDIIRTGLLNKPLIN